MLYIECLKLIENPVGGFRYYEIEVFFSGNIENSVMSTVLGPSKSLIS